MSATLGVLLKEIEPALTIAMFETLHDCAQESSNGWNNAGTGHAGNCELYFTPQRNDGSVDISKALEVNTEFDLSRQLWSFLVDKGAIRDPRAFIHPCPHMSFVQGAGSGNDWNGLTMGHFVIREISAGVDPKEPFGVRSGNGSCCPSAAVRRFASTADPAYTGRNRRAHHERGSFGADASGRPGELIICGRFNLPNDIDEGTQTGWNIPPPRIIEA
jgi:hypothetical protein